MQAGTVAGCLLRLACAPRAAAFQRALDDVEAAQRATLARILRASARTEYGRSIGLGASGDVDEFPARVPIVDYATLEPWISRQRSAGGAVLTPGGARHYEPTSGSGGAAKRIPYNAALLSSFRALFAVWAHDLLSSVLRPRSGRTFISVSSPVRDDEGFADDRQYLGAMSRAIVGRFLVTPPRLAPGDSPVAWRDALSCALAACEDLEVISIWNPGYLLVLLQHFERNRARLLPALAPARRVLLQGEEIDWQKVWPALQLVSCWREGPAAAPAARLAALFPRATLQGKGLVATEAPLSVPLGAASGCVPLVDEVFIELESADGRTRRLHEAQTGEEYEVLLSQAGGLLRYRLGDRVRILRFYRGAPVLAFAGRADNVADLVGEKLSEALVARALEELASPGAFCTLLPVLSPTGRPYYRLLTDDAEPGLAATLESALMRGFRYREARTLGQLDCVRVTRRADMRAVVHDALIATGMKAGDIKDRALILPLELAERLRSRLAADQRELA